jgi:hypothetical protein
VKKKIKRRKKRSQKNKKHTIIIPNLSKPKNPTKAKLTNTTKSLTTTLNKKLFQINSIKLEFNKDITFITHS